MWPCRDRSATGIFRALLYTLCQRSLLLLVGPQLRDVPRCIPEVESSQEGAAGLLQGSSPLGFAELPALPQSSSRFLRSALAGELKKDEL